MKLNFNFSGKTLLKDWWKIVRDNFTAIQTDHNELSDRVNTHKTAKVIDHPDKSVTSAKIADKAIHTSHMADYVITKDKISDGAVTTDKVANSSITTMKLSMDIVENLGIFRSAKTQEERVTNCLMIFRLMYFLNWKMTRTAH